MDNTDLTTAVRNHLTSFLGTPSNVVNVKTSDSRLPFTKLEIAVFSPEVSQPTIFATCGLAINQILDGRRMELLFIAQNGNDPDVENAAYELLGAIAVFAATAIPPLNYGRMIAAKNQLESICPMEGVIFFPPFMLVNQSHGFTAPDQSPVQLMWVVPIFEGEADYANTHDARALANLFAANELNLTDLHRPRANLEMTPKQVQSLIPSQANSDSSPQSNHLAPQEITLEQIARFRESNDVVIDVSQRLRAKHRAEPNLTNERSTEPKHPQPSSPSKSKPTVTSSNAKNEIRFDLNTGKQLTELEAKQRSKPQIAPDKPKTSLPKAQPLSPKEEKQNRISALKAAAQDAKKRSKDA